MAFRWIRFSRISAVTTTRITIIGLCQGDWLSAIYASLFSRDLKTLVLAGAPIDFQAGEKPEGMGIREWVNITPYAFYWLLVASGGGLLNGQYLLTGFKVMNYYDRYFGDYLVLLKEIRNKQFLERYRPFHDWYEYTQNLAGAFYLQIVYELFMKNLLIKGELVILGRNVNLKNINCPVYLIAGSKDNITPPDQLFNICKYVRGDVRMEMADSGHIGLFMGEKTLREIWEKKIFEQLKAHEGRV